MARLRQQRAFGWTTAIMAAAVGLQCTYDFDEPFAHSPSAATGKQDAGPIDAAPADATGDKAQPSSDALAEADVAQETDAWNEASGGHGGEAGSTGGSAGAAGMGGTGASGSAGSGGQGSAGDAGPGGSAGSGGQGSAGDAGPGGSAGSSQAGSGGAAGQAGSPCTGTHDEDSDGRLDTCDNCPTWPNANQLDSDADGLGNVCELSSPSLLSSVAYFESFAHSPSLNWDLMGLQWSPDRIRADDAGCFCMSAAAYDSRRSVPLAAETVFRFSDGTIGHAGVFFTPHASVESELYACVFGSRADDRWLAVVGQPQGFPMILSERMTQVEPLSVPYDTPRIIRMYVRADGGIECSFYNQFGHSATVVLPPRDAGVTSATGFTGLYAYNVSGSFDSFVLYEP